MDIHPIAVAAANVEKRNAFGLVNAVAQIANLIVYQSPKYGVMSKMLVVFAKLSQRHALRYKYAFAAVFDIYFYHIFIFGR
jgi:hypothetical protein